MGRGKDSQPGRGNTRTRHDRNALDPTEAVMIRGKGKGDRVVSTIRVPDHYSFS